MGSAWPASAVPLEPAVAAAGGREATDGRALGDKPPCPRCGRFGVYVTNWPSVGHWLSCPHTDCGWCGHGFDYLIDRFAQDKTAARNALQAAGCRPPKSVWSDSSLSKYRRYIDSVRLLQKWATNYMSVRRIGRQPGAAYPAHNHPAWWAMTRPEWDYIRGRAATTAATDVGDMMTIVPGYDAGFRVIGATRVESPNNRPEQYAVPGTYGGLLFRHGIVPGRPTVMCFSPATAFHLQATYSVDHAHLLPIVCPVRSSNDLVDQIAADARGGDYVIASSGVSSWAYILASTLGARIYGHRRSHTEWFSSTSGAQVYTQAVDVAEHWADALAHAVDGRVDAWWVKSLITGIGWPGRAEVAARERWPRSLYDRVAAVAGARSDRVVEVSKGFWVTDTPAGWVDGTTGEVLVQAVPYVTSVVRSGNRKVYVGTIRYGPGLIHFSSARFRKDPVGVIETQLLKAGWNCPPPHPKIVRHMVDLACYLGREPKMGTK